MTTSISFTGKCKMLCRLQPDSDGYPPVAVEGLWVRLQPSGSVILDNIPFFAKGLAPGDELRIKTIDGEIWFEQLIKSGGASVFRIHVKGKQNLEKVREELLALGLPSEVNGTIDLIAVEIPFGADIRPALDYLILNQEAQRFDFEEGVLRHPIPE
jgi:hypothetical protein